MNDIWVVLQDKYDEDGDSFTTVLRAADRPQVLEQWIDDYVAEQGLNVRKSMTNMSWYGNNVQFYVLSVRWLKAQE